MAIELDELIDVLEANNVLFSLEDSKDERFKVLSFSTSLQDKTKEEIAIDFYKDKKTIHGVYGSPYKFEFISDFEGAKSRDMLDIAITLIEGKYDLKKSVFGLKILKVAGFTAKYHNQR